MHQGVVGGACRILDDDYVTGYTVDGDFYCVAFGMHAARVLPMLTSKLCKTAYYECEASGFWRSPSLIALTVQIVWQRL